MRRLGNSGVAALEFGLVVPVLLFMAFGLIDMGRLFYTQTALAYVAEMEARCRAIAAPTSCPNRLPGLESAIFTATVEGPASSQIVRVDGRVTFWSILFPLKTLTASARVPI